MKHLQLFVLLIFHGIVQLAYAGNDEFKDVKCGSEIPKVMIGKHSANGPVLALETTHKDIQLKNEGGESVGETESDGLSTVWWQICGNRFLVLYDKDLVRDVLSLPTKSDTVKEVSVVACKTSGKKVSGSVFVILNGKDLKNAWKIDRKAGFVSLPTEGLQCPLD